MIILLVSNVYELQGTLRDLSKAAPEAGQSPSLNQNGEVRNPSTGYIMYENCSYSSHSNPLSSIYIIFLQNGNFETDQMVLGMAENVSDQA